MKRAGALAKNKEALAREKERLMNEVANNKERLNNSLKYQEELEKKCEAAEARINELSTELEVRSTKNSLCSSFDHESFFRVNKIK